MTNKYKQKYNPSAHFTETLTLNNKVDNKTRRSDADTFLKDTQQSDLYK